MQTIPINVQERAYFEQFRGDEPEPYPETHYFVFDYYGRFVMFETADRDAALQVARWDAANMGDNPEQRIVEETVMINARYQEWGFFIMPGSQERYQETLDALAAA